ncbi:putative cytochrome P450 49a1 [Oratosquilla oratoria]|uniref:putative cytochrome P450 49a1 n=1 Tax=Oratosquilla oratoria TaxID=337810 RepID=UPI003F75E99B
MKRTQMGVDGRWCPVQGARDDEFLAVKELEVNMMAYSEEKPDTRFRIVPLLRASFQGLRVLNRPTLLNSSKHGMHLEVMASAAEPDILSDNGASSFGLKAEDIPGPRKLPFIGSLLSFVGHKDYDPDRLHLLWSALVRDHGSIFQLHLPGQPPTVVLSDADYVKTLLDVTRSNPIRPFPLSLRKLRHKDPYFEGKAGVGAEQGEEWRRVRSRVQTPLMKPKVVASYMTPMDGVATDFIKRIEDLRDDKNEVPPDFLGELYKWALESIAVMALNKRLGCFDPAGPPPDCLALIHNVNLMFEAMNECEFGARMWQYVTTPSFYKMQTAHAAFKNAAIETINQTEMAVLEKQRSKDTDAAKADVTLMEMLMSIPGLSRKDVTTMILDMIFGGIDTTAHMLAFALYALARNPEAQERVRQEVDRVTPDPSVTMTSKHLAQMSYMKAFVKETLRMFPVGIMLARLLEEDAVLGGYHVPRGWLALCYMKDIYMDEKYFPRAKEFLPERWMRDSGFTPTNPFAFLPFSHGTRMCLGRRIAEQEVYTLLSRILQRYRISYNYPDLEVVTKVTLTPHSPLTFTFEDRNDSGMNCQHLPI